MSSPGGSARIASCAPSPSVDIWSDIHCPWALITIDRLRRARQRHSIDVVFVPRAWPLEWVNRRGTPRGIVTVEAAVLAEHEPELFSAYANESWPSTFLPAFELVAAANRVGGLRAAENVDYALRLAFFRDGVDVSIRDGLERALAVADGLGEELDAQSVMDQWLRGNPRADVAADYAASAAVSIQGSPQVMWMDGTSSHNPGMTDHEWIDGVPVLKSVDSGTVERMLLATSIDVGSGESSQR